MKQTLIIFLVVILGLIGLTLYFLFSGGGKQTVGLEFGKIEEVAVGQPFLVDVSFTNNGSEVLKNTRLSLTLPKDVYFVGEPLDQRVKERIIGDVGPGSLGKESFNLIAQGEMEERTLKAVIKYGDMVNSRVVFETIKEADFQVGRPAIALEVSLPDRIFSGENFDLSLKYRNDGPEELKNLTLKMDYPPIFQFERSSAKPDQGNNIWKIGRLSRGEEFEFTVSGNIVGQENSSFDFLASLMANLSGQDYVVNKLTKEGKLSEAPLSVSVLLNGSSNYVAKLGDTLTYSIVYKNNSGVDLSNVMIKAKMAGEMFDFSSLTTSGVFDAFQKSVTWTGSNLSELQNVPNGKEGQVEVAVKVKDGFSIKRISDKNYLLKFQVDINSETPVPELDVQRLVSLAKLETKVAGQVAVDARAYFRDAASGILNSGNFPPRSGQITQFTIHWIIRNFATDIDNVKVTASLSPGIRWANQSKSNSDTGPTFDDDKKQVVWVVSKILATRGVVGDPMEGVFQIEAVPNGAQVGQILDLLGNTKLEAHDSFADVALFAEDAKLDTNLPDDVTVGGSLKTVQL